jgi:hypothetical protein
VHDLHEVVPIHALNKLLLQGILPALAGSCGVWN